MELPPLVPDRPCSTQETFWNSFPLFTLYYCACAFNSRIRSAEKLQKVTLIQLTGISIQRSALNNPTSPALCALSPVPGYCSKCALHLGRGRSRGIHFSFRFQKTKLVPPNTPIFLPYSGEPIPREPSIPQSVVYYAPRSNRSGRFRELF